MKYIFFNNNHAILNWAIIIFNTVSISIGITAIFYAFSNIPYYSILSYDGILSTFIGICTTFVVGFQIWNYIYHTNKLDKVDSEIEKLEKEKEELRAEIDKLKGTGTQSMYYNAYTIGRIHFQMAKGFAPSTNDKKYYWNALRALAKALKYASQGGHDFADTYKAISGKIYFAIDSIIDDNADNHLIFDTDENAITRMKFQIDTLMEEVKTFIMSDKMREFDYKEFVRYCDKWKYFTPSHEQSDPISVNPKTTHI